MYRLRHSNKLGKGIKIGNPMFSISHLSKIYEMGKVQVRALDDVTYAIELGAHAPFLLFAAQITWL